MGKMKRFTHIDLMESIAILFVLIYHGKLYPTDITASNSILAYIGDIFTPLLSTCVSIFFFVNGYLLLNKPFNLKKHIYKIIKIIFLVFIWGMILMPLCMIMKKESLSIKNIISYILNLDSPHDMNIFWFLGALTCIYILFPALKALFDTNKNAFIFFIGTIAIFTFGFYFINQILDFFSVIFHTKRININYKAIEMFNPFRGISGTSFIYFCVGGLIYKYEDKILAISTYKRNLISAIGIIISCILSFLVDLFYKKFFLENVGDNYPAILIFLNVIFIYLLCLNYKKDFNFIRYVSCNTLGIYILHLIFMRLTISWIRSIKFFCNIPGNIVYDLLIICMCLGVCIILKKIPLLKELV